jgi:RNA polymerase sigma-70 factor (ECF subfamily)
MNSMAAGVYQWVMTLPEGRLAAVRRYTAEMAGPDRREGAFEDEAMPHTASLLRAAITITRDPAVAEDLVQDTLLRAWRFFDRFEPGTNCKAWLFRIMLNLSTRVRQKRTAEATSLVPIDETTRDHRDATDADVLEQSIVRRAFDALPQDQRAVLHLAIMDGFTCKEISDLLSLPMGTVMSRMSRGRAALRDALAGQGLDRGKGTR